MNDVEMTAGAVKLARVAHQLGLDLTSEQCDELSRAAIEGAEQYRDGVGPDLGWPPLPDPNS